jgi:hypothetical protein
MLHADAARGHGDLFVRPDERSSSAVASGCAVEFVVNCLILTQRASESIMSKSISVRVSSALFEEASTTGATMTRSGAQQLEHWARLGQALERQGLDINAALQLLASPGMEVRAADAMWSAKRTRQQRDRAAIARDVRAAKGMLLFPVELAQAAKVLNGPY